MPAPNGIVTLLTDFGDKDGYVAQMKGVLLSIHPRVTLVDITHRIEPQSVLQGALALRDTVPHFPEGTIHVAIVDPGVGSRRRGVVACTRSAMFVGPDNGLLWPAVEEAGGAEFFELVDPRFQQALVSPTFHGRDLFAPAAAHLCAGVRPEELGPRVMDPLGLKLPEAGPSEDGQGVDGEVLRVDRFGNLVTNVRGGHLLRLGLPRVIVEVAGRRLDGIAESYFGAPAGALVCVIGSAGFLEIAESGGSAATRLGVSAGTRVTVKPA